MDVRNAGIIFVGATLNAKTPRCIWRCSYKETCKYVAHFTCSAFFFFCIYHCIKSFLLLPYSLVRNLEHVDTHIPHAISQPWLLHKSLRHLPTHICMHKDTHIPSAVIISSDKSSFPQWSLALWAPTTATYNGPVFWACSDYTHKELHYTLLIQFPLLQVYICVCVVERERESEWVHKEDLIK